MGREILRGSSATARGARPLSLHGFWDLEPARSILDGEADALRAAKTVAVRRERSVLSQVVSVVPIVDATSPRRGE